MSSLVHRLLAVAAAMTVVAALAFQLVHLAPGDPAALMAGDLATADDIAHLRTHLGLDQAVWRQFGTWISHLLHGDFGTSVFTHLPVTTLIAQRLEPTLSIASLALPLALCVAVALGSWAAWNGGRASLVVQAASLLAFSMPTFLTGYLLMQAFSLTLAILPVQGYAPLAQGIRPWLASLALPCLNVALVHAAFLTRLVQAALLGELERDYLLTARAKGLGAAGVLRHAWRNAAVPVATAAGSSLGLLLGGVAITESVFSIPGLGRLSVDATLHHDYPVIQALLLLAAAVYGMVNLLVDMLCRWLDPRIGH